MQTPIRSKPTLTLRCSMQDLQNSTHVPLYTCTVVLPASTLLQVSQNRSIEGLWEGSRDSSATTLLRNTPRRRQLVAVMHASSQGRVWPFMPSMRSITYKAHALQCLRRYIDWHKTQAIAWQAYALIMSSARCADTTVAGRRRINTPCLYPRAC